MVAICTMICKPFHFETWLNYHFSIGVEYIFLRVENTPELEEIISKYSNVFAYYDSDVNTFNNYWTIQKRQNHFFETIKQKMLDLNIEWVVSNIDSDELLCCENINEILKNVPKNYDVVQISNYEAVYSNDNVDNPFIETNTFIENNFLAYGNGKSASRLNEKTETHGPHSFKGSVFKLLPRKICVLHYESSNFERWYTKFKNYNQTDKELIDKIPFPFYKESIEIIREGNKEKARKYFNKKKVDISENTLKLYWTPTLQQKNICWG